MVDTNDKVGVGGIFSMMKVPWIDKIKVFSFLKCATQRCELVYPLVLVVLHAICVHYYLFFDGHQLVCATEDGLMWFWV